MKLELNIVSITDIQFGDETTISDHTLFVNRNELSVILLKDKRLKKVEIEIAHPGEKCRILQVSDVIEPRAKLSGGEDFPGFSGKALRVKGLAVFSGELQ